MGHAMAHAIDEPSHREGSPPNRLIDILLRRCREAATRRGALRRQSGELAPLPFAYRLCRWPSLPPQYRKASVLQAISRMSCGPVSHHWFVQRCGLDPVEAEALLASLHDEGAVHRIDLSRFHPHPSRATVDSKEAS